MDTQSRILAALRCVAPLLLLAGLVSCGDAEAPEIESSSETPHAPTAPSAPFRAPAVQPTTTSVQGNSAPVIDSVVFQPEKPIVGDVLRVLVEAADADGQAPFLKYEWKLGGRSVDSSVPKLLLTGTEKGDDIELTVTASDGKAESAPFSVSTEVYNAPPKLLKLDVEPAGKIVAGQPIVLRADARDPDGDSVSLSYRWVVNGRPVGESGPSLSTAEFKRGDEIKATVVASDAQDDSEPMETPLLLLVNTPPRIVSWPGAPGADGVFEYHVEAEDPDGTTRLMFELEKAPAGMTIDAQSGEIRWTPAPDQLGTFSVAVIVDDLEGGKTRQAFELSTAAPPAAAE